MRIYQREGLELFGRHYQKLRRNIASEVIGFMKLITEQQEAPINETIFFFQESRKNRYQTAQSVQKKLLTVLTHLQIQMRLKRHSPSIRNGMFRRSRNTFSASFQMNLNHLNQTKFPFPELTSTSNLQMVVGSLKHFSVLPSTNKFQLEQSN